jgi:hypothetical protein
MGSAIAEKVRAPQICLRQAFPLCETPKYHNRSGIADRESLRRRRGAVGRYEEGSILNIKEHANCSGETNDANHWNEHFFRMGHVRTRIPLGKRRVAREFLQSRRPPGRERSETSAPRLRAPKSPRLCPRRSACVAKVNFG